MMFLGGIANSAVVLADFLCIHKLSIDKIKVFLQVDTALLYQSVVN
jgi:hypothetical protein